jgi:hypothetical protein
MMAFENKYIFNNYRVKQQHSPFIGRNPKFIQTIIYNSTGTGFCLEQYHDLQLVYLLEAKSFEYLPRKEMAL